MRKPIRALRNFNIIFSIPCPIGSHASAYVDINDRQVTAFKVPLTEAGTEQADMAAAGVIIQPSPPAGTCHISDIILMIHQLRGIQPTLEAAVALNSLEIIPVIKGSQKLLSV